MPPVASNAQQEARFIKSLRFIYHHFLRKVSWKLTSITTNLIIIDTFLIKRRFLRISIYIYFSLYTEKYNTFALLQMYQND